MPITPTPDDLVKRIKDLERKVDLLGNTNPLLHGAAFDGTYQAGSSLGVIAIPLLSTNYVGAGSGVVTAIAGSSITYTLPVTAFVIYMAYAAGHSSGGSGQFGFVYTQDDVERSQMPLKFDSLTVGTINGFIPFYPPAGRAAGSHTVQLLAAADVGQTLFVDQVYLQVLLLGKPS